MKYSNSNAVIVNPVLNNLNLTYKSQLKVMAVAGFGKGLLCWEAQFKVSPPGTIYCVYCQNRTGQCLFCLCEEIFQCVCQFA